MSTAAELDAAHQNNQTFAPDEPDKAASRLHIDVDRRGSAVIIHVRGELDAYTLPTWRHVTREAAAHATAPGPIIIDINRLDFISCDALIALALDADVCGTHGINFVVVSGASIVHRITAATGLDACLSIHPSMDAALLATAPENDRC